MYLFKKDYGRKTINNISTLNPFLIAIPSACYYVSTDITEQERQIPSIVTRLGENLRPFHFDGLDTRYIRCDGDFEALGSAEKPVDKSAKNND